MFIIYSEVFSPPFVHSHHLHQKRARDCNYPMQFLAHFLELQGCWGGRSGSNDHVIEGRMRIEWIKLAVFDRYYIFFHLSIIKIIEGRHISGPNTQHFHPRSKEGRESTILRQQISESIRKEGDKITKVTGNWQYPQQLHCYYLFLYFNKSSVMQWSYRSKREHNHTLLPLSSTSLNSFTTSLPTISFTPVNKMFIVPSKLLKVPLKKVSLLLSLTQTGRPRSCLMKSAGLPFRLIIINSWLKLILICQIQMIGTILETLLLFINAIAILNEKRFLKKYGFSTVSPMENNPNETLTSKSNIIMLMYTLRSFGRYFLIVLNVIAIVLEILG